MHSRAPSPGPLGPPGPPPPLPRRRLRPPRRTIRLRLTLLYAGMFLLSGAALLSITYLLVAGQFRHTVRHGTGPSATAGPTMTRAPATEELHTLLLMSGISLGIMTVGSIALGWLIAGRVLRPLRTMAATTRQISDDSLHRRLDITGPRDEITHLADTVDGLLARLEAAFAAERRFVADASHELRTPLTLQRTLLEVALSDPAAGADRLRAACERVLAAGRHQERLVTALMTLARSQRGLDRREPVDLAAVTGEILATHHQQAQRRGLHLDTALRTAPAAGDPLLAQHLAANLIDNAIRHNTPNGWIAVTTGARSGRAVISVANSGPVVPPTDINRLTLPFQRQAPDRTRHADGHGLGLSIVRAIADAHGAELTIHPQPAGGLNIEVAFPAATGPLTTVAADEPAVTG